MSKPWHMHNQLRSVVLENTQIGEAKRRGGTERDKSWNAMSIRSYKTRKVCDDLAKQFGRWMEERHQEVKWARDIRGEFVEWIREIERRGAAPSTLVTYVRRWKKIVRRMEGRGWCRAADLLVPLEGLVWPGARALEARRRGGAYAPREAQAVMAVMAGRDAVAALAYRVMLRCGLRSEEVFTLTREQVQAGGQVGRFLLTGTQAKGGRGRWVEVDAEARGVMRDVLAVSGWAGRPFALRATPTKTRKYMWRLVTEAAKGLGVRPRGLHGARATAIRRWVKGAKFRMEEKEALRHASERAGHSRVDVTSAYTEPGPGEARGAVKYEVPEVWAGRVEVLQKIAETGIELAEAMGQPAEWILEIPRPEMESAVRIGMWGGVILSIRLTMGMRLVMEATPRRQYPFRAGLGRGQALRIVKAVKEGMLR